MHFKLAIINWEAGFSVLKTMAVLCKDKSRAKASLYI